MLLGCERRDAPQVVFDAGEGGHALRGIELRLYVLREHEGIMRANFHAQMAAITAAALAGELHPGLRDDRALQGAKPAVHLHRLRTAVCGIGRLAAAGFFAFAVEHGLQFGEYRRIHRRSLLRQGSGLPFRRLGASDECREHFSQVAFRVAPFLAIPVL